MDMLLFLLFSLRIVAFESANWAQLAGERTQTIVKPYIPQQQGSLAKRPMWSRRWGHTTSVLNQTSIYRNDLSVKQNSERSLSLIPTLFVLGGDDYAKGKLNSVSEISEVILLILYDTHYCIDEYQDSSGGLRNDVWSSELSSSSTATWLMNDQQNTDNDTVVSTMKWNEINSGKEAPLFWPNNHEKRGTQITFDDWISCQKYFGEARHDNCDDTNSVEHGFFSDNMWSPRRGHASAVFNGALFVIGGRSKEQVRVHDERLFDRMTEMRNESSTEHFTIRQSTILKNDVWVSHDGGESWGLVTPGCKDHQKDILAKSEIWSMKSRVNNLFAGSTSSGCHDESDCYGAAVCSFVHGSKNKVCTCTMFSAREHHSLSVQHRYVTKEDGSVYKEDYLYLVGGFANIRHEVCGNNACGSRGSYRVALDDAWVSNDGTNWVQLRPATIDASNGYEGRGAHSSLLVHANLFREQTINRLWIFGGEHISQSEAMSKYLNDVWYVELNTEPCCASHNTCRLNVHPLTKKDIGHCLPAMLNWTQSKHELSWSERAGHVTIHEPPSSLNKFTDYIYLVGGKNSTSVHSDVWSLDVISGEPWQLDFSAPDSNVVKANHEVTSKRKKVRIPNSMKARSYYFHYDLDSTLRSLMRLIVPVTNTMTDGIFEELVAVPLINYDDITVLEKTGLHTVSELIHASQRTILLLRGFDYPGNDRSVVKDVCHIKALVEAFESKCQVNHLNTNIKAQWDGCQQIKENPYINIHGIGNVPVPLNKPDTSSDLENMFCKQTPGSRYMAAGEYVDGKVLLLGGQGSVLNALQRDVWSRDSKPPLATIKLKPKSRSSQSNFLFDCDEDGALQFEHKLFDLTERLDVTPWQPSRRGDVVDVSWLDTKKGGPGSGLYTLYVRAGKI